MRLLLSVLFLISISETSFSQDEQQTFGLIENNINLNREISEVEQRYLEEVVRGVMKYQMRALSLMRQYPNDRTIEFICKHLNYTSNKSETNLARKYPVYNIAYNMPSEDQRKVGECLLAQIGELEFDDEGLLLAHRVINKGNVSKQAYHEVLQEALMSANEVNKERIFKLREIGSEWLFEYEKGY